jgi:hypothetical protein
MGVEETVSHQVNEKNTIVVVVVVVVVVVGEWQYCSF